MSPRWWPCPSGTIAFAVGLEAKAMIGPHDNIIAYRPMKDGDRGLSRDRGDAALLHEQSVGEVESAQTGSDDLRAGGRDLD